MLAGVQGPLSWLLNSLALLVCVLFEPKKPLGPVLGTEVGVHEVRVGGGPVLIGHHDQATLNLGRNTGNSTFHVRSRVQEPLLATPGQAWYSMVFRGYLLIQSLSGRMKGYTEMTDKARPNGL